jgi:FlaA1/EpsC-like NDP-sugar epimerase
VAAAGVLWRSSAPLHLGYRAATGIALLIAVVFSTVNALLGLHRVYWSKAPASATLGLAFSTGLATLVVLVLNLGWRPAPLLPSGLLIFAAILAYGLFVLFRYRERLFTGAAMRWLNLRKHAHATGERVLIVGAGEVGTFAAWLLRKSVLAKAFTIVGMVDDAPHKQGLVLDGLRVLDYTANIPRLVQEHDIGLLLFAIADIDQEDRRRILALVRQTPARVVLMPDILQTLRERLLPSAEKAAQVPPGGEDLVPRQRLKEPAPVNFPQWLDCLEQYIQEGSLDLAQAEVKRMRRDLAVTEATGNGRSGKMEKAAHV